MDIFDFLNFLENSKYNSNVFVWSMIVTIGLVTLFVRIKILRHPRYRNRIIASCVAIFFCVILYMSGVLSIGERDVTFIVLFILLAFEWVLFRSARHPIGLSARYLNKLSKISEHELPADVETLMLKNKSFHLTTIEKFEYIKSCQKIYFRMGKHKQAYVLLNTIKQRNLFPKEIETLALEKAQHLLFMGAFEKTQQYLAEVHSDELSKQRLLSVLYERRGDLDNLAVCLEKALTLLDHASDSDKAQIYNNYGRMRLMQGNETDAIFYYKKAATYLKTDADNSLRHIVYQNIIHTLCRIDPNDWEIERYCDEYFKATDFKSEEDFIEHNNFLINLYRQRNSRDINLIQIVADGYTDTVAQLTGLPRYCFEISSLRMTYHLGIHTNTIMNDIRGDFEQYFKVAMPDRFRLFKELRYILSKTAIQYSGAFDDILKRANDYYCNNALADLDEYYGSLEPFEIDSRCTVLKDRIGCIKESLPYQFEPIYAILKDISDIYEANGLYIETIENYLNIADECIDINNLDTSACKPKYPDIILEYVNKAEAAIAKLKGHPSVSVFHLRMAVYLLAIEEEERSRDSYLKFNQSEINFLADWLQRYYMGVTGELLRRELIIHINPSNAANPQS